MHSHAGTHQIVQKFLSYAIAFPTRVGAGRGSIGATSVGESDAYEFDFDAGEDDGEEEGGLDGLD